MKGWSRRHRGVFQQPVKSDNNKFLLNNSVIYKDTTLAVNIFVDTIEKLKRAGKIPVLFTPPPRSGFNTGECLERKESGFVLFKESCSIPVFQYLEHQTEVRKALQQVVKQAQVHTVWLDALLCDETLCKTKLNDTFLYRDGGHLSITGSEKLFGNMQIKELIRSNELMLRATPDN